jgi:hypothetical protein
VEGHAIFAERTASEPVLGWRHAWHEILRVSPVIFFRALLGWRPRAIRGCWARAGVLLAASAAIREFVTEAAGENTTNEELVGAADNRADLAVVRM